MMCRLRDFSKILALKKKELKCQSSVFTQFHEKDTGVHRNHGQAKILEGTRIWILLESGNKIKFKRLIQLYLTLFWIVNHMLDNNDQLLFKWRKYCKLPKRMRLSLSYLWAYKKNLIMFTSIPQKFFFLPHYTVHSCLLFKCWDKNWKCRTMLRITVKMLPQGIQ